MIFKRISSFLFAFIMMLSVISFGSTVYAEDTDGFDVSGSKEAEPTELDSANRDTTVTLQLPAGEYKYTYDVVFVMDSSSSTVNSNIDFSKNVTDLMDVLIKKNIKLNVGVIKVRGLVFDTVSLVSDEVMSGMIEYSDDTKETIKNAINYTEANLKALSSGTNIHGGLVTADKWLTEDTEVPDDHKYVFLLTDGKTYIWNDENDVPTTIYGQYMAKGVVYPTPAVGQQTIAYSKSAYRFVDGVNFFESTDEMLANLSFDEYFEQTGNFYSNDFVKLYASTNAELSDPTKYDYRCGYAYKEGTSATGTVTQHDLTNGNYTYQLHKKYYEFVPSGDFAEGFYWMQANPYTVEENEGVYSYTTTINPDFYQLHPDSLQKALYLTGHLWTDMVDKYNGAALVYNGWGGGSGLEIAKSFNTWIVGEGISDYAADIADAGSVDQMFNEIKENILYMVSSGVVTDKITDEFTLKNADKQDGFSMTLSGETLPVTFDEGKWYFGDAEEGTYPYEVAYDAENKTITWTINVPVENVNPITLSYTLTINEDAESGFYDTNKSAVLEYTSSDGTKDGTYTFEKPRVSYIKLIDITVTKVWDDADNQDGKRTGSITAKLMDGNETVQTLEINERTQWAGTFSQVPDSKIVEDQIQTINYNVDEEAVEGYEAAVIGTVEEGFVIANTHKPEVIDIKVEKSWYDADDQDGKRTDSVKVQLYAGEKAVGDPVELTEKAEWKYTWEGVDKYAAGSEIKYTVKETEVPEGYTAEVSGTIAEGFVVTNTHEPETTDITVEKVWDDSEDKYGMRPEEITVNLLADGEEAESVTISEEDGWKYTFEGMPKYAAGKEITYTVTEEAVEGYETSVKGLLITNTVNVPDFTITYKLNGGVFDGKPDDIIEVYPGDTVISIHKAPTREGFTFLYWEGSEYQPDDKYTVTEDHTFTAQWKEKKSDAPDTGDNSNIILWTSLLGISAVGIASVVIYDRKRRLTK